MKYNKSFDLKALPAGLEALPGGGTADRGRLASFSGLDGGGWG